jgi:hypothetical protein
MSPAQALKLLPHNSSSTTAAAAAAAGHLLSFLLPAQVLPVVIQSCCKVRSIIALPAAAAEVGECQRALDTADHDA